MSLIVYHSVDIIIEISDKYFPDFLTFLNYRHLKVKTVKEGVKTIQQGSLSSWTECKLLYRLFIEFIET